MLKEDTQAPYLFIICPGYVLRTSTDIMKENGFKLVKERSRRYPAKNITDVVYADDIAFLANTPTKAKSLQHSLERAADSIGLHVNVDKTEYMNFNQTGDISTVKGVFFKLVDKFTYHRSSVSSTENDINTRIAKVWKLSTGYRSDGSQT